MLYKLEKEVYALSKTNFIIRMNTIPQPNINLSPLKYILKAKKLVT